MLVDTKDIEVHTFSNLILEWTWHDLWPYALELSSIFSLWFSYINRIWDVILLFCDPPVPPQPPFPSPRSPGNWND